MKKIFLTILLLTFLISPLLTLADGKIMRRTPEGLDFVDQNYQQAFISHRDGIERLIIDVDIEGEASEMVWIIPLPVGPEKVEIDVLSELPIILGQDINERAKSNLKDMDVYLPLFLTQVHFIPFPFIFLVSLGGARGKLEGLSSGEDPGVSLFAHIEKEDMTVELLTAKDSRAVYNYLSKKGIKADKEALQGLDLYIEKDCSFVASWISSDKIIEGDRAIYISFPVKDIYYPLIPTSVYGEKIIPTTIRVLDYVKPEIYSEIKPYTEINYYGKAEYFSNARKESDARQISLALEMHYDDHGRYPDSLREIDHKVLNVEYILERFPDLEKAYRVKNQGRDYELRILSNPQKETIFSSRGTKRQDIPAPSSDNRLKEFFGENEAWKGSGNYTKITINSPSKNFKKDLWMKSGEPFEVLLASIPAYYPWVITILLGLGISFLAAGISGLIVYKGFKKYALLGLFNILTIIALYLALRRVESEKRARFLLLFSILFIILIVVWMFILEIIL